MYGLNNAEFDISEKNKLITNVENTISQIQTITQLLNDINFRKYIKNKDDNILLDTMQLRMKILINKLPNKMEYLEHNDENIYCYECNSDVILVDDNDDLDEKEVIILTNNTIEKKPRKKYIYKCPHGKQKSKCIDCGGSGICKHNKRKEYCIECDGSEMCVHGKQKSHCIECRGVSICVHNKLKVRCAECGGSAFCEHNKRKEYCVECSGSAFCEHNKRKENCVECGGSGICKHDKQKASCVECDGSSFCEHKKRKRNCVKCDGSGICVHNKIKRNCVKCGGSNTCIHKKQKAVCVKCNGSQICIHKKLKSHCKLCGGSELCKSSWCETTRNRKYEGYCLFCYVNKFPDKPISRNYKTKELNVVDNVKEFYPNFTWRCDKKICDGCSKRRPDMLVDLGSHIIIVEVDENAHTNYDSSCENKRMMELSKDVGHRPIVFIRFNPDQYIDRTGEVVKSCWKIDNRSGIFHVDTKKEGKWKDRLLDLNDEIQYWIDNPSEKTIEIVELFY
jgi:hypothetical protein